MTPPQCEASDCTREATRHVRMGDHMIFVCDFLRLGHPITEACLAAGSLYSVDEGICVINKVSVFGKEP